MLQPRPQGFSLEDEVDFVDISGEIGRAVVHTFWQDVAEPKLSIDWYSPHPKKIQPSDHDLLSMFISHQRPDIAVLISVQ